MSRVVLVTGVSRYLGGRLCRELSVDPRVCEVIGVDVVPPTHDLGRAQFIRADIRNPVIAKIIDRHQVHTVCHLSVIATPTGVGGRVPMKEINVIGSMQLLAACGKSASVRRLVVKSTAAVYGGSPRDPACFSEEDTARSLPRSGWGMDCVEVEGYVRGFSRRRPDVDVAVLRFANVLGAALSTEVTEYFRLPVAPTVMGFDPRLQFVHEQDLIAALVLAATGDAIGTINVAGDGVLTLTQALGITGRPPLPVPRGQLDGVARTIGRVFGVQLGPDLMRMLTYGRALDTTRMRTELGFEPVFDTRETFTDMVHTRGVHPLLPAGTIDSVADRIQHAAHAVQKVSDAVGGLTRPRTGVPR